MPLQLLQLDWCGPIVEVINLAYFKIYEIYGQKMAWSKTWPFGQINIFPKKLKNNVENKSIF
jgi:hypothetical protein